MNRQIEPGGKAVIRGLKKRVDLNGKAVTVQKKLGNGRVAVEVPGGKEVVAIRPENLALQWSEIEGEVAGSDMKHWGMDEEECPLCMDTLMNTATNAAHMECCGAAICIECFTKLQSTPQRNACPMCRADTSDSSEADSLKKMRARASRGDANAMYNLGCFFDNGQCGVEKDQAKARTWFKKAALAGESRAAYNLAFSYRDGEGGPVDKKLAAKYFRMAAEKGHIQAMTCLGEALMNGDGVEKDIAEAKKWQKNGADAGDSVAQQHLDILDMMSAMGNKGNVSFSTMMY